MVKKTFLIRGDKLRATSFELEVPYIPASRQLLLSYPLENISKKIGLNRCHFFLQDEASGQEVILAEYPFLKPLFYNYENCQGDSLSIRVNELPPLPVAPRTARSLERTIGEAF